MSNASLKLEPGAAPGLTASLMKRRPVVNSSFRLAYLSVPNQLRFMESHEVLREVLDQCNAKQLAADMGLSLSLIYKWAEPAELGSGTANPLDRIDALVRCSKDLRIAQWICERAGGFFIKNPKALWPHPHFLIPATNQVVQEFADLLAVVASAAADNTITRQEARSIRARWEELKCATEGFVRCCEEGNFAALKKEPNPPASR